MRSKTQLLTQPQQIPLISEGAIARSGAVLIVAPHPDDESLGCGGAIALLRQLGCAVRVLIISDGTKSHPNSRRYPPPALRALREQEALTALAILGVAAENVTFLRLPDGAVSAQINAALVASRTAVGIARVQAELTTHPPQTIFLPWRHDPHPDHRATTELIFKALTPLNLSVRLLEYLIWDWDVTQRDHAPLPAQIVPWRLDISAVLPLKQNAIAAHRSQTTNLIDDDPQGFCLTPEMLAHFAQPWELYLELKL